MGTSGKKIEVDCLIVMDDVIAVVEAKSIVNGEAFKQLKKTHKHIKLLCRFCRFCQITDCHVPKGSKFRALSKRNFSLEKN